MELPSRLQDLAPEWAHFCLDAERFMRDELGLDLQGETVLAGVSGGLDSCALLLVLHYLSPRLELGLKAAHFDHCLRPESASEADFVADLCRLLGIECFRGKGEVRELARKESIGLEEAGRSLRLEFLSQHGRETGADFIALGHHLNDLAEDQLMRMLRGTGWPALGGMRARRPEKKIIRPLLLFSKERLSEFVRSLGLNWIEDPSNQDRGFLRNRIRLEILPLMLRENPNYLESAAALWRQAGRDREYWLGRTGQLLASVADDSLADKGEISLPLAEVKKMESAPRLRLFKQILERLGPGQPLFNSLANLERAVEKGASGPVFQFPGKKTVQIKSGRIIFRLQD